MPNRREFLIGVLGLALLPTVAQSETVFEVLDVPVTVKEGYTMITKVSPNKVFVIVNRNLPKKQKRFIVKELIRRHKSGEAQYIPTSELYKGKTNEKT